MGPLRRRLLLVPLLVLAGLGLPGRAAAAGGARAQAADAGLTRALSAGIDAAGVDSGAEAVDETTGTTLFADRADAARLPASVEKLYTTSAVLDSFGADAHLETDVLGVGERVGSTFRGTLYLRGGGDPTFGSASFDQRAYGTGSTPGDLAATLRRTGIRRLEGSIVADPTVFDAEKGTPATGGRPSIYVEGVLSGLTWNRGWANPIGTLYYADPALEAGRALALALSGAGIALPPHLSVRTGRTPVGAEPLAAVASPSMATLVRLTNTPSDNFFAETLLKDLGADYGAGGSTAAGAAVVRADIATRFGLHPRFDDGSGLARYDRTTPAEIVSLLGQQAQDPAFVDSLAITGRTGTLVDENRGSYAAGRCRGKTGTLHDVSNNVGYCRARDGHLIAYALLMNGVDPDVAHPIQNRMQTAIADYDG